MLTPYLWGGCRRKRKGNDKRSEWFGWVLISFKITDRNLINTSQLCQYNIFIFYFVAIFIWITKWNFSSQIPSINNDKIFFIDVFTVFFFNFLVVINLACRWCYCLICCCELRMHEICIYLLNLLLLIKNAWDLKVTDP
jgi:hypothetical protein